MDAVLTKVKTLFDANATFTSAGIALKLSRTGDDLPYAVMTNVSNPIETRTNTSRYFNTTFTLSVYTTTDTLAFTYRDAVLAALNEVDLALSTADGKSLFCSVLDDLVEQMDTEVWAYIAQFEVKRQEAK
jgi:hypothetical protein